MTEQHLAEVDGGRRRAAARAASGVELDDVDADAAFAAAAWSALVEPGDGVGGALRRLLGPVRALEVVTAAVPDPADPDRVRPDEVLTALAGTGHDLDGPRVRAALRRWAPRATADRCVGAVRSAVHVGARLLVPGTEAWPAALDDLADHAPAALWVRGPLPLPPVSRAVSLVGARASSAYGTQVAADLAGALGDRGRVVVSGGAYGIDGTAHRAALRTRASTVSVTAGGVDRFYPRGHDELLRRVVDGGALVSEVVCGTTPSRWRFLQRNRIIAALGGATVVVEAGRRSGTLNTAGHASVLGRPVGAVPGPVTSPSSAGCHALLRSGLATCVTGVVEVIELLDGAAAWHDATGPRADDDPDRPLPEVRRVLDALSPKSPRQPDDLARATGLDGAELRGVLAELELLGRVRRTERGWLRAG